MCEKSWNPFHIDLQWKSKEVHKLYEQSFQNLIDDIRARQHEFDNHINTIYSQHYLYDTYDELVEAQTLLYDEINPADIEGGGRVIAALKDGEFKFPEDADEGLIYIGLNKNFEPVTGCVIR